MVAASRNGQSHGRIAARVTIARKFAARFS